MLRRAGSESWVLLQGDILMSVIYFSAIKEKRSFLFLVRESSNPNSSLLFGLSYLSITLQSTKPSQSPRLYISSALYSVLLLSDLPLRFCLALNFLRCYFALFMFIRTQIKHMFLGKNIASLQASAFTF